MIGIKRLCQVLNISQYKLNKLLKENHILIEYPYVNPKLIAEGNADVVIATVKNVRVAKPVYRVKFIEAVIAGTVKVEPIPNEYAAKIECSEYISNKQTRMISGFVDENV
jgi:hypothetical protein